MIYKRLQFTKRLTDISPKELMAMHHGLWIEDPGEFISKPLNAGHAMYVPMKQTAAPELFDFVRMVDDRNKAARVRRAEVFGVMTIMIETDGAEGYQYRGLILDFKNISDAILVKLMFPEARSFSYATAARWAKAFEDKRRRNRV